MRKAERTRQFIITKTASLFNSKGFAGTSITDLTKATGLTKGSIYGNFRDKEDIAVHAFQFAVSQVKQLVQKELESAETNRERLLAYLGFYQKYVFEPPIEGGCPLLNHAVEADDFHTAIRHQVLGEMKNTVAFITKLLEEGIASGEFGNDFVPEELAYIFFCIIEGGIMFSRVEQSDRSLKIVINHCTQLLDHISLSTEK